MQLLWNYVLSIATKWGDTISRIEPIIRRGSWCGISTWACAEVDQGCHRVFFSSSVRMHELQRPRVASKQIDQKLNNVWFGHCSRTKRRSAEASANELDSDIGYFTKCLMEGVANHLDFDDVLHSSSRNQKRTAQKHNRKSEAYV